MQYVTEHSVDGRHEGVHYLDFLAFLDRQITPASYFEIGTNSGDSLTRFECDAVCVDPHYVISQNVIKARKRTFFFQMTADKFFAEHNLATYFPAGIDIAFLDGLHRFDFLLRDFINTEKFCHRNSVILMHDCLPHSQEIASRAHRNGDWAGDVWKIVPILKKSRPDLKVIMFDSPPTGLVACTNLDPESRILEGRFHDILSEFLDAPVSTEILRDIRSIYPFIDTRKLCERAEELTALLPVHRIRV